MSLRDNIYSKSHSSKPSAQAMKAKPGKKPTREPMFDLWLASRALDDKDNVLVAGAQRPITWRNLCLAWQVLHECASTMLHRLWSPRLATVLTLNLIRSLFPVCTVYSQALIIDEIQLLLSRSDGHDWWPIARLAISEVIRRALESFVDSLITKNENVVMTSARFFVERHQLELRVRLDTPTMSSPVTQALLQESDLFTRTFSGVGFGFMSPLDVFQIISLMAEISSHLLMVWSLVKNGANLWMLFLSVTSVFLPILISWLPNSSTPDPFFGDFTNNAVDQRERMRSLAYGEAYRSEVAIFGLDKWIIKNWSDAWKSVMATDDSNQKPFSFFSELSLSHLLSTAQNIPCLWILQSSSASIGTLTLYRSTLQAVVMCSRSLLSTLRMAFHSVFLLAAFTASMQLKPVLQPSDDARVDYKSEKSRGGMTISARSLSYTYPGSSEPAVRDVSFDLEAGKVLAIVGFNGSGKSTLAKALLRLLDFHSGELSINGVDIRRYHPKDYHTHVSAVLQDFSKYNFTLSDNVGLGNVNKMSPKTVGRALHQAEADGIIESLPQGLSTPLETPGFEAFPMNDSYTPRSHGLSGGEWQRVAIARAFMRASEPDVDLLVFDEPTSSLDAYAQNQIFDTIHNIARAGARRKTVIIITHRLSWARRADKIAMMDKGTITELGSHEELLRKDGSYAALYKQSV